MGAWVGVRGLINTRYSVLTALEADSKIHQGASRFGVWFTHGRGVRECSRVPVTKAVGLHTCDLSPSHDPPPNATTLGVRISTYKFWGSTVDGMKEGVMM